MTSRQPGTGDFQSCQRAAFLSSSPFASSDTGERDIYIEEEYDIDNEEVWTPRQSKVGVMISAREIRHIEFFEPEETI
jgi:hypothetical protein